MSEVTCRGSFALGTACGKCSRCRREVESYNAMKAVRDKLNTPSSALTRIEELESKLAKAVGLLEAWVNVATHCTIEDGVCCCGDNMDTHAEPMDCGHSPVDHGAHIAMGLSEETSATLAEIKGESQDGMV